MIITYVTERMQIFYFSKRPPVFDEKMTAGALKIMFFAPIIQVMFSYWFLGNKQIFGNLVIPKPYIDSADLSGHFIEAKIDQSFGLLVLSIMLLILVPFGSLISGYIEKLRPGTFTVKF